MVEKAPVASRQLIGDVEAALAEAVEKVVDHFFGEVPKPQITTRVLGKTGLRIR